MKNKNGAANLCLGYRYPLVFNYRGFCEPQIKCILRLQSVAPKLKKFKYLKSFFALNFKVQSTNTFLFNYDEKVRLLSS